MRFLLFVSICLASFGLVCGPSFAERVVLTDPNPNGDITAKTYAKTDPRLSQIVSYEAEFKSVEEIATDLREMTGIKLIAGARDSDWAVQSRKMNIFVKDVPLYELMDSMARVMKFRWGRYDDVEPALYRLKVNTRAASEADAMMKRAENMKEEMWRKRRQEWINAITKYGSKSAAQLVSLRDSDPQIYEQALLGSLQALNALFKEVPEVKERFAAGRNLRISADELTPATRELCYEAGNGFWKHLQMIGYIDGKPTTTPAGYGDVLRLEDHFDVVCKRQDVGSFTPSLRWGGASVSNVGYWVLEKDTGDWFEINGFRYLGPEWNRHISRGNIAILEQKPVAEVRQEEATERSTTFGSRAEDAKNLEESLYPSEALIKHKQIPLLDQKVTFRMDVPKPDEDFTRTVRRTLTSTANTIASVGRSLFEGTGTNVVSDAWVQIPIDYEKGLPSAETKVSELLEAFCSQYNYNWDKPGPILEFRHRKWAKMRLNQIPDEWVSTWSKNTKENGYLSLDDLAAICNLTYDQAEESLVPDPVVGAMGVYGKMLPILDDNYTWLKLYASLTAEQKKALMGDRGLSGSMLTNQQWEIAVPIFDRIGTTRGEVIMQCSTTAGEDPKKISICFKEIDTDSGKTDRLWKTSLPQYKPITPGTATIIVGNQVITDKNVSVAGDKVITIVGDKAITGQQVTVTDGKVISTVVGDKVITTVVGDKAAADK